MRSMAKPQGIFPAAVQRIWSAHGLKPHLVLDNYQTHKHPVVRQ